MPGQLNPGWSEPGSSLVNTAIIEGDNNIGNVDVASIATPATLFSGRKIVTTAGTAVALAASQTVKSGVTIKALHENTGWIYVGPSGVTASNGFVLDAGESHFIDIDNLASIYLNSSVSGEGVSYSASN